ncbi:RNA polymerase II-associated protein 3 isoform X2 [Ischnura elegans]|uniref:RNA polymerase II-associated protein 3 isoform X2 n=1 Tax=Ischnura elegans TaxID=197161 RepID=UPI001ED8922B|nr:RNA polymerase II-associated protein 3 isoform X2 [Ischnura elegans]
MIGEETSCIKEKPSLLKKYDVSVNDLSYEYVKDCKDVKCLEKIIKILRSGEEGNYPDLLAFAENKLRELCPGNRLIMKPEPVPSLSSLNVNDRNKISYEMANTKKKCSIKSLDYDAWEKYDPDKEIMKMEVEEEREQEEHMHLMEKKRMESEPDDLPDTGHFSDAEKLVYSTKEKDRGNEYFKAGQFEEATQYYTRSISILPNVDAYNNRAIANLKLKKYGEVILDCNEVLKRDAKNVKALFRRGNAHESKGFYNEAIRDFERVLEVDPSNKQARTHVSHLKKKLEESNEGKPKKARMVVEDMKSFEEELKSIQIFDKKIQPSICSKPSNPSWKESYSSDPMSSGDNNKLNEWGYSRVLCNCTSIPLALQRKPAPRTKDPGKSCVQVANKYSCSQGNKASNRNSTDSGSNDGSSPSVQQPLRDMPLLTGGYSSAVATSGANIDNAGDNSVDCDVEMQCSKDQPMEISKDDDCEKELDMDSSNSPYTFLKIWNQISDDSDYSKHARLLKRISPSNLSKVIGGKLDGDMLSIILESLNLHFVDDENLLLEFLIGISQLPRFQAIILFLSPSEKDVVRGLFEKIEQSGKHQIPVELKGLYEL